MSKQTPRYVSDRTDETLVIKLLGDFQVSVSAQRIEESQWRLRKSKSLVKLLALAPGHRLHREQLLEFLWPDISTTESAHNLHQILYVTRRALTPVSKSAHCLEWHDNILSLAPKAMLWIDAEAFEAAVQKARSSRDPALYRAALALYAGDLLPDDRYEDWAESRRHQLRLEHVTLLVELAKVYEQRQEFAAGIESAKRALDSEPTHEEAHRSLIRLYSSCGSRPQAIQQYQHLREALRRELDIEPDRESEQLYREIQSGRATLSGGEQGASSRPPFLDSSKPSASRKGHASLPGSVPSPTNIPVALDSFVGRECATEEIKRRLLDYRLVTLTGVGGCGKTRLALRVASELTTTYPDGVWLIEFAGLSDATGVVAHVAEIFGVREEGSKSIDCSLADYLRTKRMLLLFDNCEHLIEACAQLAATLLRTCGGVGVLATSRETLRIAGEFNFRVPPLSIPDTQTVSTCETILLYEAPRLFIDRAIAVQASFTLNDTNAAAVAQLCQRLDGLPLALELAAERLRGLSFEQIVERSADLFRLLSDGSRTHAPRHQSLYAAVDWSYALLTGMERRLLRRVSCLAGNWTLRLAEAVCSDACGTATQEGACMAVDSCPSSANLDSKGVLILLTRLADKSLVVLEEQRGVLRYKLLDTIRQFAQEKLRASGEWELMHARVLESSV